MLGGPMASTDDEWTIEGIYRDHHDELEGWLRLQTRYPELAADLAHEAFVRLAVAARDGPAPGPSGRMAHERRAEPALSDARRV